MHISALVDDQVKVELPPGEMEVGFAESVAVGMILRVPFTEIVTLRLAVPLVPVQVTE